LQASRRQQGFYPAGAAGGQEIRVHRIELDDELIERLIELERRFWQYVETDTAPPATAIPSACMMTQTCARRLLTSSSSGKD